MASITPGQPVAPLAKISRTAQIDSEVGCRGLLVHAESASSARAFYLHLVVLMKDILRTLE